MTEKNNEALLKEAAGCWQELLKIIARLRGEGGCPWDREQTHASLKRNLVEECYETIDAIDRGNDEDFIGELGDVLLQVVFHAQIAAEEGRFTIVDVLDSVSHKMIYRHPHVFGQRDDIKTSADVLSAWEKLKIKEQDKKKANTSLMDVPAVLPALLRAQKVQEKASRVGFDWTGASQVWPKVREELSELEMSCSSESRERQMEEWGDLMFALVNLARFLGFAAEDAGRLATEKFIRRFRYVEERVTSSGLKWEEFSLRELDAYWNEAKAQEKKK